MSNQASYLRAVSKRMTGRWWSKVKSVSLNCGNDSFCMHDPPQFPFSGLGMPDLGVYRPSDGARSTRGLLFLNFYY